MKTPHALQALIDDGRFDRGFRFRALTLPDAFVDHDMPERMYAAAGLDAHGIVQAALTALGQNRVEFAGVIGK